MGNALPEHTRVSDLELQALREGRVDDLRSHLESGSTTPEALLSALAVYQEELRMQTEQLRRNEAELTSAVERFARLFQRLPVIAMLLDETGHVVGQNLRAVDAFGDMVRARPRRFLRRLVAVDEDKDRIDIAFRDVCRDGFGTATRVRLAPLSKQELVGDLLMQRLSPASSDQIEVVCVVEDRTEAVRAARLEELAAQEAQARQAAEARNVAINEFLSRVSHELRTPLNAILGFAQVLELQRAQLNDTQRQQIEHIAAAGWHLTHVIDDLLDITRIESSHDLPLDLKPVAVDAVAAEVLPMLQAQAQGKEVALQVEFDEPRASLVLADRARLRQVLLNLISNGIKYNRRGGSVTLQATSRDDLVHVTVRDTGVGLAPEQLSHLFEPFNRLGRERSHVDGTGLGLAISRRLIEAMGGSIDVRSQPDRGTAVHFWLPVAI
jgi:signal transduction histidine kinase